MNGSACSLKLTWGDHYLMPNCRWCPRLFLRRGVLARLRQLTLKLAPCWIGELRLSRGWCLGHRRHYHRSCTLDKPVLAPPSLAQEPDVCSLNNRSKSLRRKLWKSIFFKWAPWHKNWCHGTLTGSDVSCIQHFRASVQRSWSRINYSWLSRCSDANSREQSANWTNLKLVRILQIGCQMYIVSRFSAL